MKKIVIFSLACILYSCDAGPQTKTENLKGDGLDLPGVYDHYQFEFEGCEYLYFRGAKRLGICHKGNCKNPIHKN